ncbi:hypothetical protein [Variovorax sp. 770b2]|uniref:hypothetical protein n=1 Tax=Variovorax sp. 770b2 TaxID=1566271 RepID=UPI0008F0CBF5|nr:hypothetical protein [Variovorax sp. 770b2]SFP15229.1 hypothetical protein SAMN03159339_0593 [Variovorax sp. 770b2]
MSKQQIGRDARTGEFIPVREAIRRPTTTVVETITRPARPTVTKPVTQPPKRK